MFDKYKTTSTQDLKYITNNRVRIIKYPELANFDDFEDLIEGYEGCIILYETSLNNGHWVLLYPKGNVINFFDSYGFEYPNDEMKFINPYFREKNGMDKMLLYNLIFKYPVYHNDIQFQSMDPNVKTCGLWCCVRLLMKNMSPATFKKNFLDSVDDPDELVVKFINLMVKYY